MTLKELEKKIAAMERRLAKLEKKYLRPNGHKRNGVRKTRVRRALRSNTRPLTEREKQERALEILRDKGIISEPTGREKKLAAEWMKRPEEERRRMVQDFRASAPNVSLGDIVIENRR